MTETLEHLPLTDRQRAIYDHIVEHRRTRGYSPTVRELADAFAMRSPNGMKQHLELIKRKGYLTWEPNMARTLRPVEVTDGE